MREVEKRFVYNQTKRPKEGPWVVPLDQAKGPYIHTAQGVKKMMDLFDKRELREDQLIG